MISTPSSWASTERAKRDASSTSTSPIPSASTRPSMAAKPGLVSTGSAPDTASSANSATTSRPAAVAWRSMARRWRRALSLCSPTLAAEEVRR